MDVDQDWLGLAKTRKEALARGENRYFTGQPCCNGHIAPRNSSSWACLECRRVIDKTVYDRDREKRLARHAEYRSEKPRSSRRQPELVSLDRLRSILKYDATTGYFAWAVAINSGAPKGSPAGRISCHGYLRIQIDNRCYQAHRLAWFYAHGEWPKNEVDHINGNRLDNRIANLRDVTTTMNARNQRRARKNSTSGFLGVWAKKNGTFVAAIKADGRRHHIGTFQTAEEAHAAYVRAKAALHPGAIIDTERGAP